MLTACHWWTALHLIRVVQTSKNNTLRGVQAELSFLPPVDQLHWNIIQCWGYIPKILVLCRCTAHTLLILPLLGRPLHFQHLLCHVTFESYAHNVCIFQEALSIPAMDFGLKSNLGHPTASVLSTTTHLWRSDFSEAHHISQVSISVIFFHHKWLPKLL